MNTITTKFAVGDTVWHANVTTEQKKHPCPDCHDTRKWKAESPAGHTYEVPCPRCSTQYQSNHKLQLLYTQYTIAVRRMTIGSVRVDTGDESPRAISYMCRETGVGSGTIYYEKDLFPTEAEANEAAKAKALELNNLPDHWVKQQYDARAEFCDYQLHDAEIKAAEDKASRAWARVDSLIFDLECLDSEDVNRTIEQWREITAQLARNP